MHGEEERAAVMHRGRASLVCSAGRDAARLRRRPCLVGSASDVRAALEAKPNAALRVAALQASDTAWTNWLRARAEAGSSWDELQVTAGWAWAANVLEHTKLALLGRAVGLCHECWWMGQWGAEMCA